MERLYVLFGKARSGKDTVANIIKEYYQNKKVLILSYGYFPKWYSTVICNWDGTDENKPRSMMQKISVESRKINPGYVVRRMEEDINILKDYFDIIIIDDTRLLEEIQMPKQFKETFTIKVTRPNFQSPLTKQEQSNITETALDNYNDYDYLIENNSTIEELNNKVTNLLERGII